MLFFIDMVVIIGGCMEIYRLKNIHSLILILGALLTITSGLFNFFNNNVISIFMITSLILDGLESDQSKPAVGIGRYSGITIIPIIYVLCYMGQIYDLLNGNLANRFYIPTIMYLAVCLVIIFVLRYHNRDRGSVVSGRTEDAAVPELINKSPITDHPRLIFEYSSLVVVLLILALTLDLTGLLFRNYIDEPSFSFRILYNIATSLNVFSQICGLIIIAIPMVALFYGFLELGGRGEAVKIKTLLLIYIMYVGIGFTFNGFTSFGIMPKTIPYICYSSGIFYSASYFIYCLVYSRSYSPSPSKPSIPTTSPITETSSLLPNDSSESDDTEDIIHKL